MTIWYRIILTLYMVLMACISLITVLWSLNFIPHRYVVAAISAIPGNTAYCLVSSLVFISTVLLLIANMGSSSGSLQLAATEHGKVQVGKDAIEHYAETLAQEIYGVYSVKATIFKLEEDGIYIRVNSSVEPGIVIPDTSAEIKSNITEGLRKATGIEVKLVDVYFKQIQARE